MKNDTIDFEEKPKWFLTIIKKFRLEFLKVISEKSNRGIELYDRWANSPIEIKKCNETKRIDKIQTHTRAFCAEIVSIPLLIGDSFKITSIALSKAFLAAAKNEDRNN